MSTYNDNLWNHVMYVKPSKRNKKLNTKLAMYLARSGTSVSQHLDQMVLKGF